ncbi:GGDEF domain-containing protein [Streptomyces olivochromogenes]|uniref:GGDEF domain-containing protein n=1 Tax=Streptomyces olivochromogenes TaxID=1963 RepID=UPI001F2E6FAF|nr:GGDEF domain-containing protein [Streptomyces olivochromogenes]MCF3132475.1 GGDEF domain-containing protein [Streptomyces olivochromogenes]
MPSPAVLRQRSRTLVIAAAAVPLALAVLADDVRVRRQLEAARRDPLSGLPGRPELLAYTDRLLRSGRRSSVYVLLVDGDRFKAVNDTYGHACGDTVIRTTGQRLVHWSKGRHAVAVRLGGDEFAVATALPAGSALTDIAALRRQLQQPIHHRAVVLQMTVSVGIACAADLPGETADTILRGADVSMYKVKTGEQVFPYLATRADAYADAVNGRRAGRPGAAQEPAA